MEQFDTHLHSRYTSWPDEYILLKYVVSLLLKSIAIVLENYTISHW